MKLNCVIALTKTSIVHDFSLGTMNGILPVDVFVIKEPLRAVVSLLILHHKIFLMINLGFKKYTIK